MTLEIWDSPGSSVPLLEAEEEEEDPWGEWDLWGVLGYCRRHGVWGRSGSISHNGIFEGDEGIEQVVA